MYFFYRIFPPYLTSKIDLKVLSKKKEEGGKSQTKTKETTSCSSTCLSQTLNELLLKQIKKEGKKMLRFFDTTALFFIFLTSVPKKTTFRIVLLVSAWVWGWQGCQVQKIKRPNLKSFAQIFLQQALNCAIFFNFQKWANG